MIRIETEKDGKINAAIRGALDEVIPDIEAVKETIDKEGEAWHTL